MDIISVAAMLPLLSRFQQLILPDKYGSGGGVRTREIAVLGGHVGRSLQLSMVFAYFSHITVELVATTQIAIAYFNCCCHESTAAEEQDAAPEQLRNQQLRSSFSAVDGNFVDGEIPFGETNVVQSRYHSADRTQLRLSRVAATMVGEVSAQVVLLVCAAALLSVFIAYSGESAEQVTVSATHVSLSTITKLYLQMKQGSITHEHFSGWLRDYQTGYAISGYEMVYLRLGDTKYQDSFNEAPYNTMHGWQYDAQAFDLKLPVNSSASQEPIPSSCMLEKGLSLEEWAGRTSAHQGCTSAVVIDARKFWSGVGIKLAWFTLVLSGLTLGAILTFAADFIRILLPLAQVAQAVGSFMELFTGGWSEPPDGPSEAGWCERHVHDLLGKREKIGDGLVTLSDAMIGAERCFQIRLLDCRRMVTVVQWALERTDPLFDALVEKGPRIDSGELVWADVDELLQAYSEDMKETSFEFEEQAVSILKEHGELAALALAMLAKKVQVEDCCFNDTGHLTLHGAKQAITQALHQTFETVEQLRHPASGWRKGTSSEQLSGVLEGIKRMLSSSIMQSVQTHLEQVGVSPTVFQKLHTVGAAIPSDQVGMLDLLRHAVVAVSEETSNPIALLAASALKDTKEVNLDAELSAAFVWALKHTNCSPRLGQLLQDIVSRLQQPGQSWRDLVELLEQNVAEELSAVGGAVAEDTLYVHGTMDACRAVQAIVVIMRRIGTDKLSGAMSDRLAFCSTVMEALMPFLPADSWVDVVKEYEFPESSQGLLTDIVLQTDKGKIVEAVCAMLRVKLCDTKLGSKTAMISEESIRWMLGLIDNLVNATTSSSPVTAHVW